MSRREMRFMIHMLMPFIYWYCFPSYCHIKKKNVILASNWHFILLYSLDISHLVEAQLFVFLRR
jgi:hypothetical protein